MAETSAAAWWRSRSALLAVGALTATSALAGCSINTMIWGPDGSAVIDKTNAVIAAAAKGAGQTMACPGSKPNFGRPSDWVGVGAEEPQGDDSGWGINVSKIADVASGDIIPVEIDYRGEADSLCVDAVYWSQVTVG